MQWVKGKWLKVKGAKVQGGKGAPMHREEEGGQEKRRKGDGRKGVISQPQPNLNFSYFLRVKEKWLKAKGAKVQGEKGVQMHREEATDS